MGSFSKLLPAAKAAGKRTGTGSKGTGGSVKSLKVTNKVKKAKGGSKVGLVGNGGGCGWIWSD